MFAFIKNFKRDESGLALTEYLILLGLLTAVVVAAVIVFGNNLGIGWANWANWLAGIQAPAPIGSTGPGVTTVVIPGG